tara:strand:- start:3325 stop:4617 length:1293 start_codon:yes stop_codon:yes gene_type:complete
MNKQQIIKKINEFTWEPWLERRFDPFVTSFFMECSNIKWSKHINVDPIQLDAVAYQDDQWYQSKKVYDLNIPRIETWLKRSSIFELSKNNNLFYKKAKQRILQLNKETIDIIKRFEEVFDILREATMYVYATHPIEEYYTRKLNKEVPKYVKKDIDKFIGDASFPIKKNKHYYFEQAMRNQESPKKIAEEFGWIKCRFAFVEPFTEDEIKDQMKNLAHSEEPKQIEIPKPLQELFKEVKELVYLRTARTDVLYELLFLSRPILIETAKHYNMTLQELKNCTGQSLIKGKPDKYNDDYCALGYKDDFFFSNEKFITHIKKNTSNEVKGIIAQTGKVAGIVKILKGVEDLDKVKKGDILVTQMTFPSFLPAMNRAAAFITDEGGITCHAAIVAREMKKPCIIGTKNATKVLKDGMKVEVNADDGLVKIIKLK